MGWVWSPVALMGLILAPIIYTLAGAIYFASRRGRREIAFALALFFEGTRALTGAGLMYLMTEHADAFAFQFLTYFLAFPGAAALLIFAGTFATPLGRPFRGRVGVTVVVMAAGVLCAVALWDSQFLLSGMVPAAYAPWEGNGSPFMSWWILLAPVLVSAYLMAVGLHARRLAPQATVARAEANVLARAFTVRFLGLLVGYPILALAEVGPLLMTGLAIIVVTAMVQSVILAHGILKTQLFDIDLRIKWTIRKGTLAAAFVGVFFVVSEGAQSFLSEQLGPIAGLLAAGALVFAIAPLQRVADGIADRAMPRVQDNEEYRLVRKREVYRAAVESALVDGSLSDKDRGVLATLAQQLELGAKDAHDIERDARAARAGVA